MIPAGYPLRNIRSLMNWVGGIMLLYLLFSVCAGVLVVIVGVCFVAADAFLSFFLGQDMSSFFEGLENRESMSMTFSSIFLLSPLAALSAAITGSALTKIKLKPLFRPSRLDASTFAALAFAVLGLSCAASFVVNLVIAELSVFNLTMAPTGMANLPSEGILPMLFYIVGVCIGAPLCEELLFRGVILHALRPYGNSLAVIVSALFFALVHGNLYQLPGPFLMGIVFAIVTVRTGSLLPAIFLHAINNITFVLLGYLTQIIELPNYLSIVVYMGIILIAVLMIVLNRSKMRDLLSVMRMQPQQKLYCEYGAMNNGDTRRNFPVQMSIMATSQAELMQGFYYSNGGYYTKGGYHTDDASPYWPWRLKCFWTSATTQTALAIYTIILAIWFIAALVPL